MLNSIYGMTVTDVVKNEITYDEEWGIEAASTEEEIEKYQIELKKLLNDVDKIKEVTDCDEEQMIAPWSKSSILREDEPGEMLNPKEILKNVPRHSGNYVEVPIVISEEA